MPLEYDERMWRTLYQRSVGNEIITYSRKWREQMPDQLFEARADLVEHYAPAGGSVLVVGCGFGWLIEKLLERGLDAYGVDSSPYIIANLQTESDVPERIRKAQIGWEPGGSSTRLATLGFPTQYDVVVDEDVAPALWGGELAVFNSTLTALTKQGGTTLHFTSCLRPNGMLGDSSLQWKTIGEWKQTAQNHVWIDLRTNTEG